MLQSWPLTVVACLAVVLIATKLPAQEPKGITPQQVREAMDRGVEYLYSTSSPGSALVIVRFKVGSDLEQSLVRLNQKLQANYDRIPPGVSAPLIKPRTIDDVPIAAITLHSASLDHLTLRRLAAQLDDAVKALPDVAETTLIGGVRRQLRVQVDPAKLAQLPNRRRS